MTTPNSRDVGRFSTAEVVVWTLDGSRGRSDDLDPKALIGFGGLVGATGKNRVLSWYGLFVM